MDAFKPVIAKVANNESLGRAEAEAAFDALLSGDVSVDKLLAEPMFADPLRRHDCAPVTDGVAAVVIAADDKAREVAERRGHEQRQADRTAQEAVSETSVQGRGEPPRTQSHAHFTTDNSLLVQRGNL